MHQLSVSLDFPDERHDDFRRIPGLFETMSEVFRSWPVQTDEGRSC